MSATSARWGIVALWLGLAPLLVGSGMRPELHAGAITELDIGLTTSDVRALACTFDEEPRGYACRYRDAGAREVPRERGTLVPCLTVDRKDLLVPDLFEEPAIRARLESDRAQGVDARFVARCRVRVLERIQGARARFLPVGNFSGPLSSWLVVPIGCTVHSDR